MPHLNQDRAVSLTAIARQQFDPDLLPAELQVLQYSASSEPPIVPAGPEPRPPVRSDFLRWLCTAQAAAGLVDPQGIRITSATITGQLDLAFCHVSSVLRF